MTSHVGNACTAAVKVCLGFGVQIQQLRLIESVSIPIVPFEFIGIVVFVPLSHIVPLSYRDC